MFAHHAVTTKNKHQDNYFFSLLGLIICFGAAISVTLLVMTMADMGISITSGPFLLAILADLGLVALPTWLILTGRINYGGVVRFGAFALAGLMLFLNIFITSYLNVTNDFLSDQYNLSKGGFVEYSIVAQRSANIELPAKSVIRAGIQSSDACKNEATQETKKLTPASFTEYDNLSELIEATEEKTLDIAVVQSGVLTAFAEYFPDSYEKLDVLTRFKAGSEGSNTTSGRVDITKPFAIYISGIDDYGLINETSGRSDANMIILVDPEHYKILLINTPRDYYVQLHGTTGYRDKLSHSGIYGIEMGEQTLEDLYDLNIDYHVLLNFDTLIRLVDAMGGINVYNPSAFSLWGTSYAEGNIYLTGDYALMYARARKTLSGGDNDRGENQQRVIEAIISRLTKPDVVIHYKSVIKALSGTFSSNIPPKVITQLFSRQISLGGNWTIERISATGTNAQRPTYSMGGDRELSVIIPDENALEEIRATIREFMRGAG